MTTLNIATLAKVQLNQVIEHLSELDNDDTIDIYNEYADDISCERIYHNDEMTLNEVFSTPYDAIKQTNNFLYKDHEKYFTFNGYGHAISFDYRLCENSPIDIEELAQWIVDNELYNDFDIEVTTLDDILASIEDNITDDENMLYNLADRLQMTYDKGYEIDYLVNDAMNELREKDYNQLNDIIIHLNINYE